MKENYYIKIIEIYNDFIKISNKETITPKDLHNFNRIRGVIFEYIAAIYYNVLRYDDIKTSIKERQSKGRRYSTASGALSQKNILLGGNYGRCCRT